MYSSSPEDLFQTSKSWLRNLHKYVSGVVTNAAHNYSKFDIKMEFFLENSFRNDIESSNPVLTFCPASESEIQGLHW